MKCKQFMKLYIPLLLLINFHQISSTPSSEKGNTMMDDTTETYTCLKYDYQIHEALASTKPPFDNYFNISRAIFPSEDISSKLVNIWVHFTNSSFNLTEVNQLKFVWSRSCLYVSDRYLSLMAMGLYSLFTIWPDRGQEDLHITLHQFCDPWQTTRKLINFLSTLEDIAISPSSLNPSLNSVECVAADGGFEHYLQNVNKAFPQICWLILFSSLIGSNLIRMLVLKYCGQRRGAKSILSLVFVAFLCGTVLAIVTVIYSSQAQIIYPLTYLLIILFSCLFSSVYYLFQARQSTIDIVCLEFRHNGEPQSRSVLLWTAYPGIFVAVHHALWVMIGIITEPYWALPVATSFIMFAFLFYVLSALYFSTEDWNISAKINFGFMVAAGISVVMIQLSFLLIGNQFFDESLLSSAIQSALVVMISIWFRSIKDEKGYDEADYAGNSKSEKIELE